MSSAEQPQPQHVRKPPLSDVPTIKLVIPPKGQHSLTPDEACLTFCSQNVNGRIQRNEPNCSSICVRKVFAHEIRNVVSFKRHHSVGPDGKVKYPLPPEGQAPNLPRLFGGSVKNEAEVEGQPSSPPAPTKYWDEGWYLWTGKGRWAAFLKTQSMLFDLQEQGRFDSLRKVKIKGELHDQGSSKQGVGEQQQAQHQQSTEYIPVFPVILEDKIEHSSLLLPLPPNFPPIMEKVNKFLAPSYQVLGILHSSIKAGEHKEFAERVWEKAKTDEPFVLAQRTLSLAYEQWKKWDAAKEDDEKKGST